MHSKSFAQLFWRVPELLWSKVIIKDQSTPLQLLRTLIFCSFAHVHTLDRSFQIRTMYLSQWVSVGLGDLGWSSCFTEVFVKLLCFCSDRIRLRLTSEAFNTEDFHNTLSLMVLCPG